MLFEVIADEWEYWPRRCTLVVYRKGQRGYLPEQIVRDAEAKGAVRVIAPEVTDD